MNEIHSTHTSYDDFKEGDCVQIVSKYVDSYFFYNEIGKVVNNSKGYLGIRVEFDQPRAFKDGTIQRDFNFEPQNLVHIVHMADTFGKKSQP